MIHCQPVVEESYKGNSIEEHQLLARMITHALERGSACDRQMAVKLFFIFDQLLWLEDTGERTSILHRIGGIIGTNPEEIRGGLSVYDFQNKDRYCRQVDQEIRELSSGRAECLGSPCARIDPGAIRAKIDKKKERIRRDKRLARKFRENLGSCGKYPAIYVKRVLKVKSRTLNLRSKPTTRASIVTELKQGDLLGLARSHGDWHEILDKDCNRGWVAGYLTREVGR